MALEYQIYKEKAGLWTWVTGNLKKAIEYLEEESRTKGEQILMCTHVEIVVVSMAKTYLRRRSGSKTTINKVFEEALVIEKTIPEFSLTFQVGRHVLPLYSAKSADWLEGYLWALQYPPIQ